jgi:hypothetical protein
MPMFAQIGNRLGALPTVHNHVPRRPDAHFCLDFALAHKPYPNPSPDARERGWG